MVQTKKEYYRTQIKDKAGDCKGTWKILNDLMTRQSKSIQINEITDSFSKTLTDANDIANYFNSYFTEIGPKLASEITELPNARDFSKYLNNVNSTFSLEIIDSSKVLNLLKKVDKAKATGYDQISRILKNSSPYMYQSLSDLFNLSIETGAFPDEFKFAKVCPIYKSGKQREASNYRPISIIPTVARVFERLIYEQFYLNLTTFNLINPRQSGFRSLHFTATALLDLTNEWCFNIDRGMVNGVIFVDLKKAFDTVDHSILIKKLEFYGLSPLTLKWFSWYLSNRQQQCSINGFLI